MSDLLKKLKTAGAIAALGGGSLFAGTELNRPECDYVLVNAQNEEICLTEAQVESILDNFKGYNTGFGSSQFQDPQLIKK